MQAQSTSAAELIPTVAKKLELVPPVFTLPDIPQLRHVARRIDDEDEQEVRWYVGRPLVAAIAGSSGAFGNQLEIASAYGFGSLPCKRCGGRYRTRKRCGKDTVVDWCDGTGMAPKDHFGHRVTYSTALADYRKKMQKEHRIVLMSKPAPRPESGIDPESAWLSIAEAFEAQGKTLMTDATFRALFNRVPDEVCQPCRACQGIGVVPRRAAAHVEVTAYPTGSSKHGVGKPGDDIGAVKSKNGRTWLKDGPATVSFTELERYREMHDVMADMAALSPLALESLEEYYAGDNGQRAIEALIEQRFGLKGAARVRAASELRDHQCQVFNLASYGAQ